MNALEFANNHENIIVRFASQGHPAGIDVAWIPPETELPFDLAEIEGEVKDGVFTATNLNDGRHDAWGWKFRDWNRNQVYALWLRVDPVKWQHEYDEYCSAAP